MSARRGSGRAGYLVAMHHLAIAILLASCAPTADTAPREKPAEQPVDEPDVFPDVEPVPAEPVPHVTEHEIGGYDGDPSDLLFDDTVLHTIDLVLPSESIDSLNVAPTEYAIASVTVDGLQVDDVGVRLRGKIGSFRELDGKPKLRIDFDRFVEGQEIFGLEAITLNSSVTDCSYLREKLGYRIYADAGMPEIRVSWAQVTLNGAPYGLYSIVETQNDDWLERAWPDPTGNLYDGKYIWFGGWDYILLDFTDDVNWRYALEEGLDVGNSDIYNFTDALDLHQYTPGFYAAVAPLVDWPHFHAYFAAEQWIEQWDGYAGNKNNYRIYFDPAAGYRLKHVTTDLDLAFPASIWLDWQNPAGRLLSLCFADAACRSAHAVVVADFLDNLDTAAIAAEFEAWDQVTLEAALADPKRECWEGDVAPQRDDLRRWIDSRDASMRAFWGL